jgi:UMF1 family MFS transporter
MAGFFPVFFKAYWHAGSDATVSSFHLGLTNSLSALVVALLAPILGSIADYAGCKRPLLLAFSAIGIASALFFPFIDKGDYYLAMWTFGIGMIGVATSTSIYDSQLSDVTESENFHKLSALGYSLGYLGGGILFLVNVAMTLKPEAFGLADASEAVKVSFVTVGIWWAIFLIPIALNVNDSSRTDQKINFALVKHGILQFKETLKSVFSHRTIFIFLVAYWLYIDGVGTIMKMAVDYGMSLGFESSDLITALLLVQFIGFPAAIVFGRIGDKFGAKAGLYIGIGVYALITVLAYYMTNKIDFYILAVLIALVQGGVQSLSRSLYATLIPADRSAEFFGFYNMLGKFAAVIGPVLMGGVGYITGSTRLSMLSVLILFAAGGYVLSFVKIEKADKVKS